MDDDTTRLWAHALRAELEAVVTRYEALARSHAATSARRDELEALEQQLAAFAARLKESESRAADLRARLAERDQQVARLTTLHDNVSRERDTVVADARLLAEELTRARAELAAARADTTRLQGQLAEMGTRVQSLDEQFERERAFVAALTGAAGSLLFDTTQLALGQAVEATPSCLGALKARKLEAVLAQAVRERGRTVQRHPLTEAEREALASMAEAAGCELIEVPAGARFASATMEKAGTRSEPSEEDHVLECVMPGLRAAGTQGAAVHPRVIVATA